MTEKEQEVLLRQFVEMLSDTVSLASESIKKEVSGCWLTDGGLGDLNNGGEGIQCHY